MMWSKISDGAPRTSKSSFVLGGRHPDPADFGIYPAYPLVAFLPISLWQKGESGSRWRR